MKRALIATLYNESNNIDRWWEHLQRQISQPDEIVIIDGGSQDGTWEKLQQLASRSPVPIKLKQHRCNIAVGRNTAIQLTDAEIIASIDAGSYADPNWFAQITEPLLTTSNLDVVGGHSLSLYENNFQKFLEKIEKTVKEPLATDKVYPSSRNIAFRRQAWIDIGGYPEWLTLTAEDALFNFELHKLGKRFIYNPAAIVTWSVRDTPKAYFKMYYSYGYGSAEAQLFTKNYLRHWLITLFPIFLLLSQHRFNYLYFRYRKNAAAALGWLAGKWGGHQAPINWRRFEGVLLSPEAQTTLALSLLKKNRPTK